MILIGIDKIQKRVNDIGEKAPYDVTGDGRSLRNHPHWDAGAGGGSRRLSWWGHRGDMQWNWGERSAISWCHGRRLELTRTPALGRQCRRREQKAVLTRASAAIDRLYACSNWFRWRYAMYKRHKIRGFYFTARYWTTNMHPGFIMDIGGIEFSLFTHKATLFWLTFHRVINISISWEISQGAQVNNCSQHSADQVTQANL